MKKPFLYLLLFSLSTPLVTYGQATSTDADQWVNKEILQLPLKDSLLGKEISVFRFVMQSGVTNTNAHSHAAYVIGYVVEGNIETKMKDRKAQFLKTGDMFYEYPNEIHEYMRNLDASKPARIILYFLADKGGVLTKLVQDN